MSQAWQRAIEDGRLPAVEAGDLANAIVRVEVERPADPAHGDFATNLALKLARPYRRSPMEIAAVLADALRDGTAELEGERLIGDVTVAPPGFVNIHVADGAIAATIDAVVARPDAWGRVKPDEPRHINVEFVSANPTGPLHIGNARGAFVGDLLCRVLEAGGHTTTREYYFNDSGTQVRNLGASVLAIRTGTELPEDGYRGDYVAELAAQVPDDVWSAATAERCGRSRGSSACGRLSGSGPASKSRSPDSGSTSMSGAARAPSIATAGSSRRSSAFAQLATSTSRTARFGSARPSSATTRIASCGAPTAS